MSNVELLVRESLLDILHQLIARHAARAFESARLLGFAVPTAWDFGLKLREDRTRANPSTASGAGAWCRFTLRANDVTWDVVTFVPALNDSGGTLAEVSRHWKSCVADLIRGAETLPHVWIDRHPEALVGDAAEKIAKLKSLMTSDAASDEWASIAAENAKRLDYRRIR